MSRLELVSLREVARRTGVCPRTVRRWRDRDDLPVYSIGGLQVVMWVEFSEWLREHKFRSPESTNLSDAGG